MKAKSFCPCSAAQADMGRYFSQINLRLLYTEHPGHCETTVRILVWMKQQKLSSVRELKNKNLQR